jgi:hypothetical protein
MITARFDVFFFAIRLKQHSLIYGVLISALALVSLLCLGVAAGGFLALHGDAREGKGESLFGPAYR